MSRQSHAGVLVFDFVINTLLTIVEYVAGALSGSAALLADGSQNLTDSLVITVAYLCEWFIARPGLRRRYITRIYRRAGATNALILMALAVYIGGAALYRTLHPRAINSTLVIAIGLLSIVINFWAAGLLRRYHKDRTIRAPYTGLLFSGLSGIGVFASGVIARLWHFNHIDGLTGIVIAALLFVRSTKLLVTALRSGRR